MRPPPKRLEQYRERLRVKPYSLRTEHASARAELPALDYEQVAA